MGHINVVSGVPVDTVEEKLLERTWSGKKAKRFFRILYCMLRNKGVDIGNFSEDSFTAISSSDKYLYPVEYKVVRSISFGYAVYRIKKIGLAFPKFN